VKTAKVIKQEENGKYAILGHGNDCLVARRLIYAIERC
jgi:hypothetical protein